MQGDELSPGIRKIRMAIKSKGKGKSGGARIITYNFIAHEVGDVIVLLLVYDKGDASSVKLMFSNKSLRKKAILFNPIVYMLTKINFHRIGEAVRTIPRERTSSQFPL